MAGCSKNNILKHLRLKESKRNDATIMRMKAILCEPCWIAEDGLFVKNRILTVGRAEFRLLLGGNVEA
jgi:hypothetical protein